MLDQRYNYLHAEPTIRAVASCVLFSLTSETGAGEGAEEEVGGCNIFG